MKLIHAAVAAFSSAALLSALAPIASALAPFPPPSNDNCATPTVLTGTGVFPFDCSLATTGSQGQSNPLCSHVGHDLWYTWSPPMSGMATLSLCGQTNFDSAIAVYTGPGCPGGVALTCDDDACGLESMVSWVVTFGNVYTFQIGTSGGGAPGSGTFTITVAGPPANDDCAAALSIGGAGGFQYDNTLGTTGSQGQGHAGCATIQRDLWFLWTAPQNGTAELDTCGQTVDDTVVAVYAGSGCPSGAPITCNDDSCGTQSQMSWPILGGAVYLLQIGSSVGGGGGPGSFVINVQGNGTTGQSYCPGDGTGTACPCGNSGQSGHGCASSVVAAGALLAATGTSSVTSDSLLLSGSSMPPTASVLYFQGTSRTNGGSGSTFGDGLRCASGAVLRLGTKTNSGGSSAYGAPVGDTPVSVRGAIPAAGGTRDYQAWYRNNATFCTSSTFNLSNGLEVVWMP